MGILQLIMIHFCVCCIINTLFCGIYLWHTSLLDKQCLLLRYSIILSVPPKIIGPMSRIDILARETEDQKQKSLDLPPKPRQI